jgi:hypothetical protein
MALNLELLGHIYALGDCCYVLDTHIEQHRIPLVEFYKSNRLTVADVIADVIVITEHSN